VSLSVNRAPAATSDRIGKAGHRYLALALQHFPPNRLDTNRPKEGDMLSRITGDVRFNEPLSIHTSLRIGGPAEFFVVPQSLDDVRYALAFAEQEDLPVIVIGGGNNTLVSDRGVQAVVIKLQGMFGRFEFDGDEVAVGAGVSLWELIREAAARDLGGLECLAGIPASIGGALAASAGTREGSIAEFCSAVYFLHPDGTMGEFRAVGPAGPRQRFELPTGAILMGCRLRFVRRPAAKIQRDIHERLKARKSSQPSGLASAGYVWKDTPTTLAEHLIAAVGLRGKRLNGAEISSKGGNFIVNRGGASHTDVLALMEMTRERVARQFGITLSTEIQMLGFPASCAFEPESRELVAAG
jgi:UDP-N-acetylmuramate dehydrogenase